MKNPLKLQRSQFQELNSKRILNLLKKGSGLKPKKFAVGNFVLLNDGPSITVDGSRQLNFPGSKELYKIVSVQKQGFSLTLLNVRTQAILTVVHSRVTHLSLDDLLDFDISMPDLYNKLVKMNIKRRNTFVPGKSNQPLRLMTLDDINDDDTGGAGLGVEDYREDHPEVEAQEDDLEGSTEINDIINDDQQPRYN